MNYDVEREKRKSEEIRKVFREMFPLVNEDDLPSAPGHIKPFLAERIKREVADGTQYFTSRVVRILCEVSPPKNHVEDMARICVEQAKTAPTLEERCQKLSEQLAKYVSRLHWLACQIRAQPEEFATQLGLPAGWKSLTDAIDAVRP